MPRQSSHGRREGEFSLPSRFASSEETDSCLSRASSQLSQRVASRESVADSSPARPLFWSARKCPHVPCPRGPLVLLLSPSPTAASICRRNCSMGPGPILRLPPPPKSPSFHHCGTTPLAPHRLRPPPPPLPSTTHPTPRPTHTLPGGTHPPPFSLPSFHPLPATGSGLFGEPHHSLWALRTWGKARPRPNLCFP